MSCADPGVNPNIGRKLDAQKLARRGSQALKRTLCIHPSLNRGAGDRDLINLLGEERSRIIHGDGDHTSDQVEARSRFRHWMLDLQAGVHLQEIELPVSISNMDSTVPTLRYWTDDANLAAARRIAARVPSGTNPATAFWLRRCNEQFCSPAENATRTVAQYLNFDVSCPLGPLRVDVRGLSEGGSGIEGVWLRTLEEEEEVHGARGCCL